MSRAKIAVDGFEGRHSVVESLGYSHDRECYAKAVMIEGTERIVVSRSRSGPWSINRPSVDVSGIARAARARGQ